MSKSFLDLRHGELPEIFKTKAHAVQHENPIGGCWYCPNWIEAVGILDKLSNKRFLIIYMNGRAYWYENSSFKNFVHVEDCPMHRHEIKEN